jgi:hypothetical protein
MGLREEIQKRIERKRSEIVTFEAQVREARVYIQALEDTLKLLPKDPQDEAVVGMELRAGSRVARARDSLRKAGAPLHIMDVLKAMGEEPTADARAALSGSISAYVRKKEIFTRPAANTFGLIEFGDSQPKKGPPPGFGKDEESEVEIPDLMPDEDVMQFS